MRGRQPGSCQNAAAKRPELAEQERRQRQLDAAALRLLLRPTGGRAVPSEEGRGDGNYVCYIC